LLGTNPMSHIDRKRSERLQVMLASDLLAAIDEFRYRARMPTLSAAVRELLRRGLASTEKEEK
jgi:metal-responsive CopG/Arc/MetJ family transcriptional regulator